MNKEKRLYLEALRIFACYFVIFNHSGDNGFALFSTCEVGSFWFWIYLFISVFCKFAVPMFFAISGSLLLMREEESLSYLWKKRILRILIILVAWSFACYFSLALVNHETLNFGTFFFRLYEHNWNYSYWYLYAFIAYLISLPFLRTLALNLEDKYYKYAFVLVLIFAALIPMAQYLFWHDAHKLNNNLSLGWLLSSIVLYPCLGYFLEYRIDILKITKKEICRLWVVNLLAILLSCFMCYYKAKITGVCNEEESQTFHGSFVIVNCIAIFLTCKMTLVKIKIPHIIEKCILSIGSHTFGIYLLHVFILRAFNNLWEILKMRLRISPMLSAFIFTFIVMGSAYIVTIFIKKLPVVKHLV